jgi:spermidine synthase
MLSAFILGLAIGGFAIRRWIDRLRSPVRTLGWIQLWMGVLAVGTLIVYGSSFEVMGYAVRHLDKTQAGYVTFNLISHGIALIVMLPATICAGMTLPLITYQLLHLRYGEGAIGAVYASNTVGAIVGIVLAVQLVMPAFGLKSVVMLGGFLDVLLGIILLAIASKQRKWLDWRLPAAFALSILGVVAITIRLDPVTMTSGVYLSGEIRRERQVLFQRDGKTASISLFRNGDYLALTTNGKTEAAISSSELSKDEPTMILLGLLPLSLQPQAKQVATIGIGSGLTSHSLLNADWIEGVDTIEIEPAIVEAARGFNERVENVFTDPRSQIYIEDAKAFFTNHGKHYDLIVSEPSNPWVSGVAGLFSDEFYELIGNHLSHNGLLVQWLHLYHLDLPLVASVVKALSPYFSDYAVYALNLSDIAIVATKHGKLLTPDPQIFQHTAVAKDLARVGVKSIADINLRRIGTRESVDAFFNSFKVPANSDYYPYLDFAAARSRYLRKSATELLELRQLPAPFREALGMQAQALSNTTLGENYYLPIVRSAKLAEAARTFVRSMKNSDATLPFAPVTTACVSHDQALAWMKEVHELADATLPFFGPGEMAPIWDRILASECMAHLSETGKSWVALYKALDARAVDNFVRISERLLPPGHIEKSRGNDHLLATAMLGRGCNPPSAHIYATCAVKLSALAARQG